MDHKWVNFARIVAAMGRGVSLDRTSGEQPEMTLRSQKPILVYSFEIGRWRVKD